MGFRCPECKEDYGYDELAFRKHALEKHCVDTTDTMECFFWAERLSFRFERETHPGLLRSGGATQATPLDRGDFKRDDRGAAPDEPNAPGPGE